MNGKKLLYLFTFVFLFTSCTNEEMTPNEVSLSDDYVVTLDMATKEVNQLIRDLDGNLTRNINKPMRSISESYSINVGTNTRSGEENVWHIFNFEDNIFSKRFLMQIKRLNLKIPLEELSLKALIMISNIITLL